MDRCRWSSEVEFPEHLPREAWLCCAMIKRAVLDLSEPLYREDALEWFKGENPHPDSLPFLLCCDIAGVNPECILKRVEEIRVTWRDMLWVTDQRVQQNM